MKPHLATLGVATIAVLAAAGCGSSGGGNPSSGGSNALTGSGSTFQATIEQQWTSQFTAAQVTYSPVGSSTGQSQFASGTVDFAGSDIVLDPTLKSQVTKRCGGPAVTVPVTAGGVAVIYNLPGVSTLKLDADTLAKIFQGQITKWDDPAIKALNPGVNLPSTTISTYHRSDGSGTTAVLSAYLSDQAKGVWRLGSDSELNWPNGQGAEGSSGVVAGVQQTAGGITYAETSYVKGSLHAAEIKNAKGAWETPTAANVTTSIQSGFTPTGPGDMSGTLDFAKMTGYPLSTVSYIIACKHYSNATVGSTMKQYLQYVVTQGQQGADQLGYAPLPHNLVRGDQNVIGAIG